MKSICDKNNLFLILIFFNFPNYINTFKSTRKKKRIFFNFPNYINTFKSTRKKKRMIFLNKNWMIFSISRSPSESIYKVSFLNPYSINRSKFCIANCFKGEIIIICLYFFEIKWEVKVFPVPQKILKIPRWKLLNFDAASFW